MNQRGIASPQRRSAPSTRMSDMDRAAPVNGRTLRSHLNGSLALSRLGRGFLGSERIDLLEAIDRVGSISKAARSRSIAETVGHPMGGPFHGP
jgi:hypothetical protein